MSLFCVWWTWQETKKHVFANFQKKKQTWMGKCQINAVLQGFLWVLESRIRIRTCPRHFSCTYQQYICPIPNSKKFSTGPFEQTPRDPRAARAPKVASNLIVFGARARHPKLNLRLERGPFKRSCSKFLGQMVYGSGSDSLQYGKLQKWWISNAKQHLPLIQRKPPTLWGIIYLNYWNTPKPRLASSCDHFWRTC